MSEILHQLRWALPLWFVLLLTEWMPDNRVVFRLRGALASPFIGKCGRRLRLGAGVRLLNSHRLTIGNDVYLAHGTWLNALGGLTIEDEVSVAPYVAISTLQHVFKNNSVHGGGSVARAVTIGRGTWLAAHVSVKCGVRVGRGNLVAANACVVKDTPDHVVVGGVPAKVIGPNEDGEAEFYTRAEMERAPAQSYVGAGIRRLAAPLAARGGIVYTVPRTEVRVSRKALIVYGGWDGHQPEEVARLLAGVLRDDGFDVQLSSSLDAFADEAKLRSLSLIVPHWTMGRITDAQLNPVLAAVRDGGVGIAGCHGGMCDAFREATEWHFMTGGQWVAHPGNDGTRYRVNVPPTDHPITRGVGDFDVASEQYYMHVDPGVKVLATTRFPVADGPHVGNGPVDMPVLWTKLYGKGRVFYSSIGHTPQAVAAEPHLTLLRRGFAWAARE